MNPEDRKPDTDLAEVERAYRALGGEELPPGVDRAVLERARATRRARRPWSWNLGWAHTLATTAVVVLALTLLLRVLGEDPLRDEPALPLEIRDAVAPTEQRLDEKARAATESIATAPGDGTLGEVESADRLNHVPRTMKREEDRADEDAAAGAAPLAPGDWLERIRALHRSGQPERALEELRAFREAWPDHPLPPDLAALAEPRAGH